MPRGLARDKGDVFADMRPVPGVEQQSPLGGRHCGEMTTALREMLVGLRHRQLFRRVARNSGGCVRRYAARPKGEPSIDIVASDADVQQS